MDPERYEELHGSTNWHGLLDPLDLDLRTLILGYGDLASAAERAFNHDKNSKYYGYSYYGKSSFFEGVMLRWATKKYKVHSFIHATASFNLSPTEDNEFGSSWIGYIAVADDKFTSLDKRREICVVWRGTAQDYKWIDDVSQATIVPAVPLFPATTGATGDDTPQVMQGLLTVYSTSDQNSRILKSSAREQLLSRIKDLLIKYKDEKVSLTCTGYSLGASLAVLSALDLAANVVTPDIKVSAFIFGSPQMGNNAFKAKVGGQQNLKILSVKNEPDLVPLWPSKKVKRTGEKNFELVASELEEYVDIGIELLIDSRQSLYLKPHPPVDDYHNLEGMLHTLSGWDGIDGEFDWGLMKRSLGLVNLSADLLKKEYKIPASWWVETNKDMILRDDIWILAPMNREDHDLPVY